MKSEKSFVPFFIANSMRVAVLASQFCCVALYSSASLSGSAPEFPAIPEQTLIVNEHYQMLLSTVDNNGVKVGIVSVDLPDGAVISDGFNDTRVLDWLPRDDQAGNHQATIVVFNAKAINARQHIELQLNVLSGKPTTTLYLSESGTSADRTEIILIPAVAKEPGIQELADTQTVVSDTVVRFNGTNVPDRSGVLLPTYLTDPDYKIGESR